jgi:hypothetical protein
VLVLAALMLGSLGASGQARAAGSGAKIIFTAPIYAGQNNGDPEGPVGTSVVIAGSGWATAGSGVAITLADRQNDTAGAPGSACTNGSPTMPVPEAGSAPDASGNFKTSFNWSASAGIQGHAYWVCGTQNGTTAKGVQAFTVLSSLPPSVGVSAALVPLGSNVTVTGQNWLPGSNPKYDQKISVVVAPCVACDPGGPNFVSSATTSTQPDGTFSVSLPLPSAAQVGTKFYASAQSLGDGSVSLPAGTLNTALSTAANFTVINPATPTPGPTSTPGNTPTPPPTPTKAAGTGASGTTGPSSAASNTLLLLLLALGGVLLLAAMVALVLYLRSRSPAPAGPPRRGGTYYGQQGRSGPEADYPDQGDWPPRAGPPRRRTSRPQYDAPYTQDDYYGGPPPRPSGRTNPPRGFSGQQGGWNGPPDPRGYPPGPDDDHYGDAPTVGTNAPWGH